MAKSLIGIFDSGIGGLTVAKELYRVMPGVSTIYVGDTARVPYGNRSRETVIRFSRQIVDFLIGKNVQAIVAACSTASSLALDTIRNEVKIPVIGVIEPTAELAAKTTKNGRIGIIGTTGTINSHAFEKQLISLNPDLFLTSKACPLFVPLIEEGMTEGPIVDQVIDYYLRGFKKERLDTLVLGCTHYPLIFKAIDKYFDHKVQLVNPGVALAQMADELSGETDDGLVAKHHYYVSDDPEKFALQAERFLGQTVLPNQVDKVTFGD